MEIIRNQLYISANLIAYYRLEDVSDSKGAFTLTNNNSVTFESAKYLNGGSFNGSNQYLSIANDLGINGGVCSFSFWVKMVGDVNRAVFAQGDTASRTRFYAKLGGGTATFGRVKEGVADNSYNYSFTFGTSVFHHIVLTYDGSTVRGYINGAPVGTNVASSGNGSSGGSDTFTIGAMIGDSFANVFVDDFGVFNTALSADQVASIYRAKLGGAFLLDFI